MQQAAQELEAKREEIEAARAEALEALAAQDRASARYMQVGVRFVMPPLLGCFVVVTAGFTEFRILTHGIHPGLEPVVAGRILGTLDAAALLVLNFFFGSSADSRRKTEILAETMKHDRRARD